MTAAALLPWMFRLDAAGVRYAYWRGVALLCLALPWIQPYSACPTSHGPHSRRRDVGDLFNPGGDTGRRLTRRRRWGALAF